MKRRLAAEWEPQSAIQFTFPHADSDWASVLEEVSHCFAEIITVISQYEKVIVVCRDSKEIRPFLNKAKKENILFFEIASNDSWARDHGGITVEENGNKALLDFDFNGWGNKFPAQLDNQITEKLYETGIFRVNTLYKPGFILEGGSIESDGQGTILTTAFCQLSPERNPHLQKKDIENQLQYWLGAEKVLWLHHGYLSGDDTDSHIDTLARFCNTFTIAYVQCTDNNDEHFHELSMMENELKAFRQKNGQPYQLIPLPMPDACYDKEKNRLPATYANFLITNQVVLVPTYGVKQDKIALEILAGCFPDRKILGIDCRPLILQHGSLHCISMQYPSGVVK